MAFGSVAVAEPPEGWPESFTLTSPALGSKVMTWTGDVYYQADDSSVLITPGLGGYDVVVHILPGDYMGINFAGVFSPDAFDVLMGDWSGHVGTWSWSWEGGS